MSVKNIITLLEFYLKSTYFPFQGRYFEQQEGAAVGSPISPILANLYLEGFEAKAISSSPHLPYLWKRFVDDTFTIIKSSEKERFLEHLNTIDPNIQFTSEECREDGSMPFLDILLTPREDGSLSTTVYWKPTHTDLYLQWGSNHTVSSKYSVVGALHHRAKTICSNQELLQQEEDHLKQGLTRCNYPAWAINKIKMKTKATTNKTSRVQKNSGNNNQKPHMVIPYYKGISESLKNTCRKHGVQVHFKGANTIKNFLMAPKDQDTIQKKSGVIYRYNCDRVECDEEYIGESSITFGERFKEHFKACSPICDHFNTTGHNITIENFNIVEREDQNLNRWIKEALFIRINNPSLNKNIGKYHLPHIWDEVLLNTSELKLN